MKKRLKKKLKKNTFKIDDLVVFDDYIYSICWIDKAKQKSKSIYRLDGENFGIAVQGKRKIKHLLTKPHNYKVGDIVTFYHQKTDSIYTEKIIKIIDEASFRTENRISYFNYINIYKKHRKFDIGQFVYFKNIKYTIIGFYLEWPRVMYKLVKNNEEPIFVQEELLKGFTE